MSNFNVNDAITLCICIPTYNRGKLFESYLYELLKIDSKDIRYLIIDNQSDDVTKSILNRINDDRVIIKSNKKKISGNQNYFNALTNVGLAKYNLLILDRDKISVFVINHLLNVLRKKELISIGRIFYFPYKSRVKIQKTKSLSTNESIILLRLFEFNHPTGYIFSQQFILDNKKHIEEMFCDNENILYPIEKLVIDSVRTSPTLSITYPSRYEIDTTKEMGTVVSGALKTYEGIIGVEIKYCYDEIKYMLIKISKCEYFSNRVLITLRLYISNLQKFTLGAKSQYESVYYTAHYGLKPIRLSYRSIIGRMNNFNKLFLDDLYNNFNYLEIALVLLFTFYMQIIVRILLVFPFTQRFSLNPHRYYRWVLKKFYSS